MYAHQLTVPCIRISSITSIAITETVKVLPNRSRSQVMVGFLSKQCGYGCQYFGLLFIVLESAYICNCASFCMGACLVVAHAGFRRV